jgi:hypothetical protein
MSLFTRNAQNNSSFPHTSGYKNVADHMAEKLLAKSGRKAEDFFAWYGTKHKHSCYTGVSGSAMWTAVSNGKWTRTV